ncbi:hypothetical protein CLOP_g9184 [Closterium sp. NIES-67]|nr:hypothetical protein CLOP_g9184 [Closterium sp. NIES-67]
MARKNVGEGKTCEASCPSVGRRERRQFRQVRHQGGAGAGGGGPPSGGEAVRVQGGGGAGEVRQVVAGLRKFVPQAELQGRLVCAVCNLKPAKLAGQPSEAMMLAGSHPAAEAEGGEIVKLIDPPQDAAVGDRVCIQGRPASAAPVKQLSSKCGRRLQACSECKEELRHSMGRHWSQGRVEASLCKAWLMAAKFTELIVTYHINAAHYA